MSNLLAVHCGRGQKFQVRDTYDMNMIRLAMSEGRSIQVVVFVLACMEERVITIDNLHLAKDGWGVEHIEGVVIENGGVVRAILYDNPAEADPSNPN